MLMVSLDVDVIMGAPKHADGGEGCDEVLPAQVHLSGAVNLKHTARTYKTAANDTSK
jgi:hypothetical protein